MLFASASWFKIGWIRKMRQRHDVRSDIWPQQKVFTCLRVKKTKWFDSADTWPLQHRSLLACCSGQTSAWRHHGNDRCGHFIALLLTTKIHEFFTRSGMSSSSINSYGRKPDREDNTFKRRFTQAAGNFHISCRMKSTITIGRWEVTIGHESIHNAQRLLAKHRRYFQRSSVYKDVARKCYFENKHSKVPCHNFPGRQCHLCTQCLRSK